MTERKTVNGIATKPLTKAEYMKLYRTRSTEETIKKAEEMGKLDTEFYSKLIRTMKTSPQLKRLIKSVMVIGAFSSMALFSTKIAITALIHLYL